MRKVQLFRSTLKPVLNTRTGGTCVTRTPDVAIVVSFQLLLGKLDMVGFLRADV